MHILAPCISDLRSRTEPKPISLPRLQVCLVRDDDGTLATQFERDWRKMLSCGLHHALPILPRAGEQDRVKTVLQQLLGNGVIAIDDPEAVWT